MGVDVFYEIMQESFRGVDASIAGHVSRASQFRKPKAHSSQARTRDGDSDIDIRSNSSFWSDEDEGPQTEDGHQRRSAPQPRKLSRYLSTVNRSLLDRPSDLIADFYLSQLNRNMQDGVRHIEIIARDKAFKLEIIDGIRAKLNRSLSAEHLFQVRKEHLRYKQPASAPTSFTTEDVADIYKPSILENYKRKIAIELERRRRQRPDQSPSQLASPSSVPSALHSPSHVVKFAHPPIIDCRRSASARPDSAGASPPIVVQTKEVIMGRARRVVSESGCDGAFQHIGATLPPAVFSNAPPLSSTSSPPTRPRRIRIIATIHDNRQESSTTDAEGKIAAKQVRERRVAAHTRIVSMRRSRALIRQPSSSRDHTRKSTRKFFRPRRRKLARPV